MTSLTPDELLTYCLSHDLEVYLARGDAKGLHSQLLYLLDPVPTLEQLQAVLDLAESDSWVQMVKRDLGL